MRLLHKISNQITYYAFDADVMFMFSRTKSKPIFEAETKSATQLQHLPPQCLKRIKQAVEFIHIIIFNHQNCELLDLFIYAKHINDPES